MLLLPIYRAMSAQEPGDKKLKLTLTYNRRFGHAHEDGNGLLVPRPSRFRIRGVSRTSAFGVEAAGRS
jgi:hypothetical protein